jgi:hypothetical protein
MLLFFKMDKIGLRTLLHVEEEPEAMAVQACKDEVDREVVVLLPSATALVVAEVDRTVVVSTIATVVIKSTTTTFCVRSASRRTTRLSSVGTVLMNHMFQNRNLLSLLLPMPTTSTQTGMSIVERPITSPVNWRNWPLETSIKAAIRFTPRMEEVWKLATFATIQFILHIVLFISTLFFMCPEQ